MKNDRDGCQASLASTPQREAAAKSTVRRRVGGSKERAGDPFRTDDLRRTADSKPASGSHQQQFLEKKPASKQLRDRCARGEMKRVLQSGRRR